MSKLEISAAVLATLAGLVAIVMSAGDRDTDLASTGVAAGVTVGFAVLLFAGAIPRAKARAARDSHAIHTALVTSVVGFLSVASAWRGLPFVLGTGGAMLGTVAHRAAARPNQHALAVLAVALGCSAVALGFVSVAVL